MFLQVGETEVLIRIIVASILGFFIGLQREKKKTEEKNPGIAGMRTHTLVSLGSALVTAIGILSFPDDPVRLAASILTGIGFIGAGTIISMQGKIRGLINAATIWVAATIGIASGFGYLVSSIASTLLVLVILELKKFERIE